MGATGRCIFIGWPQEGLTGQVTFEQRPEGRGEEPHGYLWRASIPAGATAGAGAGVAWVHLKTGLWWPAWLELSARVGEGRRSHGASWATVKAFPVSDFWPPKGLSRRGMGSTSNSNQIPLGSEWGTVGRGQGGVRMTSLEDSRSISHASVYLSSKILSCLRL